MTGFAGGAVDLSTIGGTLGPQQSAALMEELRHMAATREQALRDRVAALKEAADLQRIISLLVRSYGEANDDPRAGLSIVLTEDSIDLASDLVSLVIEPADGEILLLVELAYDGEWTISNDEPTEAQRLTLPVYEELPTVVTTPDVQNVIVQTKKGLRIAEWTPS